MDPGGVSKRSNVNEAVALCRFGECLMELEELGSKFVFLHDDNVEKLAGVMQEENGMEFSFESLRGKGYRVFLWLLTILQRLHITV